MTKEEVLQKVNDYCIEKQYNETLTGDFIDKFSEKFAGRYPTETAIDAEGIEDSLHFGLDSVFSATSKWAKDKLAEYSNRETDYKRQIEELNKKLKQTPTPQQQQFELPKEVTEQLKELQEFKDEKTRQEKLKRIVSIAKKEIRKDLHASFDSFASDYEVDDTKEEDQAVWLTKRFQEIFRDSIGDIKPLAPKVTAKNYEEYISGLKKVKVQ